uniref:Biogenesis of lysosome-related organelles complex 1 subunit 1 n=1 Tax=Rhodosorus marinus TaxID=101924 RepID=A0A7S0BFE0_9RHOD|mmetsp:Transcript_12415/g.18002  ORF Transcript_12415/g.18002 Transcript_12415/m.18002 type:complete len:174 (+) Transcript_12415:157-678(+)
MMSIYRYWMVIGLTFLVISEVICDDVDYSAKLVSILNSKDAAESSKLVSELMKHAHSPEKHETVPDVSAFAPGGSSDAQLKDKISSTINKHIGGVASTLNNKSGLTAESRAQQVKLQTDRLRKNTQDAIGRAETHMVKLEEVETVSSDIKLSLATATAAATVIKRKVAEVSIV